MIIQETVILHDQQFTHTFSSERKFIRQVETDAIYDEAYDTLKRNFTYVETDQSIPENEFESQSN